MANNWGACHPECFHGVGKFKDYQYHIILEDNAEPVIHPSRQIPLALHPKLDKELDEMVANVVLSL